MRTGSDSVRQEYRAACRMATKQINDSRSNFLSQKLKSIGTCRDKWPQYRSLLHNNIKNVGLGLGSNAQPFCNKLALFFQDKITKLRATNNTLAHNTTLNPLSHDTPHTGNPFDSFTPVTPQEVSKLLSSLSLKFSPLDAFPSSLIKQCPRSFSAIISNLANLSFSQGLFPTNYKIAQVTPLQKNLTLTLTIRPTTDQSPTCTPFPKSWNDWPYHAYNHSFFHPPTSTLSNLHTENSTPLKHLLLKPFQTSTNPLTVVPQPYLLLWIYPQPLTPFHLIFSSNDFNFPLASLSLY